MRGTVSGGATECGGCSSRFVDRVALRATCHELSGDKAELCAVVPGVLPPVNGASRLRGRRQHGYRSAGPLDVLRIPGRSSAAGGRCEDRTRTGCP